MKEKQLEIITICGSMKYEKEMKEIALKLTLEGKIVFTPAFKTETKKSLTDFEKKTLDKIHKEKIKLSNSIFVVNVNNYIGQNTSEEIKFAKTNNKKILFLVN